MLNPEESSSLRQRAEEIAREKRVPSADTIEALTLEETRRILHELRVHQIELEMQNEELRRSQAELSASQARYLDLYDFAPVCYCTLSEDGLILESNLTATILLGVAQGDMVQHSIFRFVIEEDRDIFYLYIKKLFKTGDQHSCELRMLRVGSTPFWARVEASATQNSDGISICRVVMSDITERKLAEESLRNAHWRLENIIEGTHVGTWEWNVQTGEAVFSEVWAQIVGYTLAELTPISIKTWETLAHPDDMKRSAELLERHFAGELPYYNSECRMKHKDGHWVWVHDCGRVTIRNGDGKPLMMFGSHTDITERKRIEEDLRESDEKHRVIFNNEVYAICIFDLETFKLLDVNEAFTRLYGYHREELISRMTIHDITVEHQTSDAATKQAIREGTIFIPLRHHRKKDGTVIPVEIVGGPYVWKGQKVMFGLIHDISERKEAEAQREKLEAQNRQLQKSESLGRMAGAIAHHFNNQLQVVMMNLDFAMRGKSTGEFPTENLTGAMESTRKAAEVSRLMLIYLGQTNAKREPLELSEACLGSMPMLKATIPKGIVLDTDFPSLGTVINGNADQIQQVLVNLVTNAWEASHDGRGNIRLTVKVVSAVDIPATNRFPIDFHPVKNTYTCLEVADKGCGISAQEIETIFEPFYSSKFTGRGLGLPVVLGIVRAHSGAITVESEPGRGSVFRVFLPVSSQAIPKKPVAVAQAQASETAAGGTILVVDDEIILRNVVTTAIKGMGFTVLDARDGIHAVEVFRQHQDEIRLVVCDLTMPRMDGWQTLEALRNLAPGIPVILSSGYNEAQVLAGDHPELPQAFLSKPYEYEILNEAIFHVLNRKPNEFSNASK